MNFSTDVSKGGEGVYRLMGGTSNASPVVAGVAALMLSVNPALTPKQLKELLLKTATVQPGLEGKITSGGIVNAYDAVTAAKNLVANQN